MAQEIRMPALGESVTEGTIAIWLKQVGDAVEIDEPIVEVSTDKVDTEVPSPVAGIITEILVGEDESVDVGTVLALVEDEAESANSHGIHEGVSTESLLNPLNAHEEKSTDQNLKLTPSPGLDSDSSLDCASSEDIVSLISPHRLSNIPAPAAASENMATSYIPADEDCAITPAHSTDDKGIDLASASYISPIVRKLAKDLNVDISAITGTGVGGRIRRQDIQAAAQATRRAKLAETTQTRAAATASTRTISRATHYPTLVAHICADSLPEDYLPTVLHVIAHELNHHQALSLGASPVLGVTLAGKRGAFMPVLHNLDTLEPSAIRAALDDVTARSAVGTIGPDDLFGSTISVVDNSSHSILFEIPSIQPSHCAAISISARELRAVPAPDGSLRVAKTFYLSLTYDPFAADAHIAACFLSAVKTHIEQYL